MTPAPREFGPRFWRDESEELADIVANFIARERLTLREMALLRSYFIQWIEAPVWDANPDADDPARARVLAGLRLDARLISCEKDARLWRIRAANFGIDPL